MTVTTTWGFIGGGNMAEALLRGLIAGGTAPAEILVAEPVSSRRQYLAETYGVGTVAANTDVTATCRTVVLAVKPQVAAAVCAGLQDRLGDRLLVSIMAGVTCSAIEAHVGPGTRVVRAMPNTPALVLQGSAALCRGTHATEEDLATAEELFVATGSVFRVEEKQMDAVTGLSGSGPAYVLTFIEALADGGVKNGLPRETALGLAVQTILGTALLLKETGEHPGSLRDKVTSPGGTTIAGLHALEKGCFRGTVINAVDAATARSKELGK
jgi:pyrroline-5-carboxylate reductase